MVSVIAPLLKDARPTHDVLVVFPHWGEEYSDAPSPTQRKVAVALVENGADLVVGHHPHVLQGIERRDAGLIAYSMGNLFFDNRTAPARDTGMLAVTFRGTPPCLASAVLHPIIIDGKSGLPTPANATKADPIAARMIGLSKTLATTITREEDLLHVQGLSCP